MMLAPMEDVTDTAFRELILHKSSKESLDILFTEFTSTDGMCHPIGREKVSYRLKVSESEKKLLKEKNVKLIAQIWGNKPEKFKQTVEHITKNYDFDGIDLNFGCPMKNIVSHGSCAALINQNTLVSEIIHATRESTHLPVSVKTRLGIKEISTEKWFSFLVTQPIDAIIVHGRIQKQMSEGVANWKEIEKAVSIRNASSNDIKIIGNGDVESNTDALQKIKNYNVDGVMIGRGIFKNPWLFSPEMSEITIKERIDTLKLHISLFEKNWSDTRNYSLLKRFYKIYITNFRFAAEFRADLMETDNYSQAYDVIDNWTSKLLQ